MDPVFLAIDEFVKSLAESFPPSQTSEDNLFKYTKMIDIIKKAEPEIQKNSINKLVSGFKKFFNNESIRKAFDSGDISSIKNVPIVYGDSQKVKLEIQRFIRSDESTRECIFEHLKNIASLLDINFKSIVNSPIDKSNSKNLSDFLGDDANTEEGAVIKNMFEKFESKVKNNADPLSLATDLMADGGMDDIIKMTQGANIKPQTIKKLLVNILNNVIPDE